MRVEVARVASVRCDERIALLGHLLQSDERLNVGVRIDTAVLEQIE